MEYSCYPQLLEITSEISFHFLREKFQCNLTFVDYTYMILKLLQKQILFQNIRTQILFELQLIYFELCVSLLTI